MQDFASDPGPPFQEWSDYCAAFPETCPGGALRGGCEPVRLCRGDAKKSLVLVHGLSDSPYFMRALARHFFRRGFNVYLPLLHGHGLADPVPPVPMDKDVWKQNLRFAIDTAVEATPAHVSVGGLSTGGALSTHAACTDPRINGDLYLFSAALGILIDGSAMRGHLARFLLRLSPVKHWLLRKERTRALLCANPYKYEYVPTNGVSALSELIAELHGLLRAYSPEAPLPVSVFAAHSESDDVADIREICKLRDSRSGAGGFYGCFLAAGAGVEHSGLVLDAPIVGPTGAQVMDANPLFREMLQSLDVFLEARTAGASSSPC